MNSLKDTCLLFFCQLYKVRELKTSLIKCHLMALTLLGVIAVQAKM